MKNFLKIIDLNENSQNVLKFYERYTSMGYFPSFSVKFLKTKVLRNKYQPFDFPHLIKIIWVMFLSDHW